jgi:hypothetical protein
MEQADAILATFARTFESEFGARAADQDGPPSAGAAAEVEYLPGGFVKVVKRMGSVVQISGFRSPLEEAELWFPRPLHPDDKKKRAASGPVDAQKAALRARSACRDQMIAARVNCMATVSTREQGPGYLTAAEHKRAFSRAVDAFNKLRPGWITTAVVVPERHPANPDHFHLHVGIALDLRRQWRVFPMRVFYACVNQAYRRHGLRSPEGRGKHVAFVKWSPPRTDLRRGEAALRIAKYCAKYITKSFERRPDGGRVRRYEVIGESAEVETRVGTWAATDLLGCYQEAHELARAMGGALIGAPCYVEDAGFFTIWIEVDGLRSG